MDDNACLLAGRPAFDRDEHVDLPTNLPATLFVKSASRPPDRTSLPPFEALRVFDAAVRLGSIRKAAEWLNRDHAVVSRHLRALEASLGAQLVERTPAGVVLTKVGAIYHESVARALDQIAHATLDIVNRGEVNRLNVWCTPGFALHWLSSHFPSFEKWAPGVDLELRPADGPPDFAAHEADLDIRFLATYEPENEISQKLCLAPLAEVPIIAVASREYLSGKPPTQTPADLLHHNLLHENGFYNWNQWLGSYGVPSDVVLTGPRLWQGHLTLDAARHGRGIALTNSMVAQGDLASGRLVQVGIGSAEFPDRLGRYVMIARRDRWDERLIRKFRGWLLDTIRRELPEYATAG